MAIFDDPRVEITIRGVQGSQITETVLFYHNPGGIVDRSAKECAEGFNTAMKTNFLACCSLQWTWIETQAFAWTGSLFETYTDPVSEAGAVTGEAMPMYNSVNIAKYPDNSGIDPPAATPFSRGRIAMPAVPEVFQNNNVLSPAGVSAYASLVAVLDNYDVVGETYIMHMFRAANVIGVEPIAATPVATLLTSKLGTQNTRKP